jgi:hypothetical protein
MARRSLKARPGNRGIYRVEIRTDAGPWSAVQCFASGARTPRRRKIRQSQEVCPPPRDRGRRRGLRRLIRAEWVAVRATHHPSRLAKSVVPGVSNVTYVNSLVNAGIACVNGFRSGYTRQRRKEPDGYQCRSGRYEDDNLSGVRIPKCWPMFGLYPDSLGRSRPVDDEHLRCCAAVRSSCLVLAKVLAVKSH